jgi:hypothetical protein
LSKDLPTSPSIYKAYGKGQGCTSAKTKVTHVPRKFQNNLCAVLAVGDVAKAMEIITRDTVNNTIN